MARRGTQRAARYCHGDVGRVLGDWQAHPNNSRRVITALIVARRPFTGVGRPAAGLSTNGQRHDVTQFVALPLRQAAFRGQLVGEVVSPDDSLLYELSGEYPGCRRAFARREVVNHVYEALA
jgi:hypothetical protein